MCIGVGELDEEYVAAHPQRAAAARVALRTEADLFAFLQLPYCPPTERHA